jgi:hypothetical protein
MNTKQRNAADELRRLADHHQNVRIREHTDVLVDAIHRFESEGVRHKDLGFLTGAVWSQTRLAHCQRELRPQLRPLEDDKLVEAFQVVFVADFALERLDSNRWRLTWDEYQDDVARQGYAGIPEGDYDGDQLIDFMLGSFETPGHFCLLYNTYMERPQGLAIFPYDHQDRNTYIKCSYTGVG